MLAGVTMFWAGTRAGAPFPAPLSPPPALCLRIRSGYVFLDQREQFRHNRKASVATLRKLFAFGPECRSHCLRNQYSPSPESSTRRCFLAIGIDQIAVALTSFRFVEVRLEPLGLLRRDPTREE